MSRTGRPPLPGPRCSYVSRTGRRCPLRARHTLDGEPVCDHCGTRLVMAVVREVRGEREAAR
jgi:hypothetical protein